MVNRKKLLNHFQRLTVNRQCYKHQEHNPLDELLSCRLEAQHYEAVIQHRVHESSDDDI